MLKLIFRVALGLLVIALVAIGYLFSTTPMTTDTLLSALFGWNTDSPDQATAEQIFELPDNFSLNLYAADIPGARFMAFSKNDDLLVALPRAGQVLILQDTNRDGESDQRQILLEDLRRPHSIAFYNEHLYVAESNAIGRIAFDPASGSTVGEYQRIVTDLGDNGNHWSKTIGFGPDGMLYVSSGSTCNVCVEEDQYRAAIIRYQPDGSGEQLFATGLRNSVGFDWAPFDGKMYATDNGRDLLGDDFPPCELNLVEQGGFYGFPYVNGFGELDPDLGDQDKLAQSRSPVHGFRAHNAPLGIKFINFDNWPQEYKNSALVALHGSWNRSSHDGYKVVSLHRNSDGQFTEKDFLSGFETDGKVIGRPVDVKAGRDGCAYISDDFSGTIYRVCYQP